MQIEVLELKALITDQLKVKQAETERRRAYTARTTRTTEKQQQQVDSDAGRRARARALLESLEQKKDET